MERAVGMKGEQYRMGRKRRNHWLPMAEVLLSVAIIITAVILFCSTQTYELCFPIIFGLAFLLCLVYLAEWIRCRNVHKKVGMIIFLGIVEVLLIFMTVASIGAIGR